MATTILVLEDDLVLRDLLCEVLEDEGHQVLAADSLPHLLAIAPHHADLLITDLFFNARLGGLDAIRQVRGAMQMELPALICTAARTELPTLKDEIDRLGAYLLPKPFTLDDLVDHVNHALQQTRPSASVMPNLTQLFA